MNPTRVQLRTLAERDPVLGAAMKSLPRFPGFPQATRRVYRSHFHALGRAICAQQLSTKAAATIHDRVCALTPGKAFPTTKELLRRPDVDLRGAGLSQNKMLALQDLARKVESKELKLASMGRRPDEAVIEQLVTVRGIGEWSAQMFLMFRLGRLDVLPTGDLGIQEGLRRLDGKRKRPSPKQVERRGKVWRPLASVAAWYLWRLLEAPE